MKIKKSIMLHRLKAIRRAEFAENAAKDKSEKLSEEFAMRRVAYGHVSEDDDMDFDMLSCFDAPAPKGME